MLVISCDTPDIFPRHFPRRINISTTTPYTSRSANLDASTRNITTLDSVPEIMSSKPHSQKVRGTLDNPKTKEAMNSDKSTPGLGDATSLKPVNDNSKSLPGNDSAPPAGQGNGTPAESAPTVSEPYRKDANAGGGDKRAIGNGGGSGQPGKEDLPHSKTVRGTQGKTGGKEINKTQLGDPASLTAETSNTSMKKDTEREGAAKSKL